MEHFFQPKRTLNVGGSLVDLSIPKVMGILNLTPDSFFDGGMHNSIAHALMQTEAMLEEGADFIDIGAYSSRPNAENISPDDEIKRLIPVLREISKNYPKALISIDTFRSAVAEAAINEGAHIVNDISGGNLDIAMFQTVARLKVPYILMHMKGNPKTMQAQASYQDLFTDVLGYFITKSAELRALGVADIIVDPGFGFAKTRAQSYQLLNNLQDFSVLGLPIMAGISRKSMLYSVLGTQASEALNATTTANTIALLKGAKVLRVHDVKAGVEAIKIVQATIGATE